MRALIALLLSLWLAPAWAQLPMTGAGKGAPGVAYQGPGDVQSGAVAFYSCRAYSLATAGTKAYRIVRASDSTETDINSLATGLCDTSTPATFCNATSCKVVTYYDQSGASSCSGACDLTQATDANRPSLTLSSLNGWPCATTSAQSGFWLNSANNISSQTAPYAFTAIASRSGTVTTSSRLFVVGAVQGGHLSGTSANQARFSGGTAIVASATDSTYHSLIGIANTGTTGSLQVDSNSAVTGTSGTTTLSLPITLFNDTTHSTNGYQGGFCEGGIWPSAGSFPSSSMITNMHSSSVGWNF